MSAGTSELRYLLFYLSSTSTSLSSTSTSLSSTSTFLFNIYISLQHLHLSSTPTFLFNIYISLQHLHLSSISASLSSTSTSLFNIYISIFNINPNSSHLVTGIYLMYHLRILKYLHCSSFRLLIWFDIPTTFVMVTLFDISPAGILYGSLGLIFMALMV